LVTRHIFEYTVTWATSAVFSNPGMSLSGEFEAGSF